MKNKEKVFKLFTNCFPVKGARRSAIYDITRNQYKFIPNILYELLVEFNGKPLSAIKKKYPKNSKEINEYFQFLEENEFIFWCDKEELKHFPPLDLTWDYPAKISNTVININSKSNFKWDKLFKFIDDAGCKPEQLHYN